MPYCDHEDVSWSRFALDGWQGHYRRTRRWFDRLIAVANNWDEFDMDEQIDFALVFFQSAYHLRDYLARDGAATKVELDELMASSRALRVCRDLCLGAKHREIDRPSVDPEPWIMREYRSATDWPLRVKAGELYDLIDLARDCMIAWDSFLDPRGLDPRGPSPLAARVIAALAERDLGPREPP